MSLKKTRQPKLVFWQNESKRWFWVIIAGNGRKVENGTQGKGFARLENAQKNFNVAVRMIKILISDVNGKELKGDYTVMMNPARVEIIYYKKK